MKAQAILIALAIGTGAFARCAGASATTDGERLGWWVATYLVPAALVLGLLAGRLP